MSIIKNILAVSSLCLLSPFAQADSCNRDIHEMQQQISKYGSITTRGGNQVQYVYPTTINAPYCTTRCHAHNTRFHCSWDRGNWGNTLVARG